MSTTLHVRGRAAIILLSVVVILLSGCGALFGPSYPELAGEDLPVTDGVTFVNRSRGSTSTTVTVEAGAEPTDLYLVFTNPTDQARSGISVSAPVARAAAPAASLAPAEPLPATNSASEEEYVPGNPAVEKWQAPALLPAGSQPRAMESIRPVEAPEAIGSERKFFTGITSTQTTSAQLVHVIDDRRGPSGSAVEFWVETAELASYGGRVTPGMTESLGEQFLRAGTSGDDIIDWVTDMVGSAWGPTPYSNLIDDTPVITVLIYNIEDNGPGGTVGYYWNKDSFDQRAVSHSNEKVMFYLDSQSLSTAEGASWEITDRWPATITSTLAHELQHTVHFYQRFVLRGANTETWLNETMSLMVEDIVSEKLGIPGPRGVCPATYPTGSAGPVGNNAGRLPRYNNANYRSLTRWGATESVLDSYSLSYSFGAYLARNFGGAALLGAMMASSSSSPDRVLQEAISSQGYRNGTLEELLWRWGVSTIRSDHAESRPFTLNSGAWSSASRDFVVGSINLYNYNSQLGAGPQVFTGDISRTVLEPGSKLIYLLATGVTGTVEISVSAEAEIDFAVVEN